MEQQELRQKIENFWYYYKWYVLGGIFLICALAVAISSCAAKKETDLYLLCAAERAPVAAQVQELEEWLGTKISEPGAAEEEQKRATIVTAETVDQWNGTSSAAMLVQVNSGKMVLYILTDSTYEILHTNEVLQDLSFAGESDFLEGDRYLLSECDAWDELESFKGSEENYYLCIRKVEGTSFEDNEHYMEQEAFAKEILKKLIAAEN